MSNENVQPDDRTPPERDVSQRTVEALIRESNVLRGMEPSDYVPGSHCPVDFGANRLE